MEAQQVNIKNKDEEEDDGDLLETQVQTVTERNDFRKSYDVIKGSIKIPGMDGNLDSDIVHSLKGMTKDDMKFQIENHAIRRLHINFIDVDAREEIEVRNLGTYLTIVGLLKERNHFLSSSQGALIRTYTKSIERKRSTAKL